jgi:hypothetical protein
MQHSRVATPHPTLATPRPLLAMQHSRVATPHSELAMRHPQWQRLTLNSYAHLTYTSNTQLSSPHPHLPTLLFYTQTCLRLTLIQAFPSLSCPPQNRGDKLRRGLEVYQKFLFFIFFGLYMTSASAGCIVCTTNAFWTRMTIGQGTPVPNTKPFYHSIRIA